MQFSCDSCQTRYQIPDEKIRGKSIRVQCKKCNGPIIVRDPALEATAPPRAQPPTPPPPPPSGPVEKAEWFVAIAGVEVGPLTKTLVQQRMTTGEVTLRSYVWRDGMASWQRLNEVPELVTLLPSRPPPLPSEPVPAPAPTPSPVEATPSPAPRKPDLAHPIELRRESMQQAAATDLAGFELGEKTRAFFKDAVDKKKQKKRGPSLVVSALAVTAVACGVGVVWWTHHGLARAATPRTQPTATNNQTRLDGGTQPPTPETAALAQSLGFEPPAAADAGPQGVTFDASAVPPKLVALEPQMQKCVAEALKRDPKLKLGHELVITTSVEPTGTVGHIGFSHEAVRRTELGRCLQDTIRTMRFTPFTGEAQPITIPLKVGLEL